MLEVSRHHFFKYFSLLSFRHFHYMYIAVLHGTQYSHPTLTCHTLTGLTQNLAAATRSWGNDKKNMDILSHWEDAITLSIWFYNHCLSYSNPVDFLYYYPYTGIQTAYADGRLSELRMLNYTYWLKT